MLQPGCGSDKGLKQLQHTVDKVSAGRECEQCSELLLLTMHAMCSACSAMSVHELKFQGLHELAQPVYLSQVREPLKASQSMHI